MVRAFCSVCFAGGDPDLELAPEPAEMLRNIILTKVGRTVRARTFKSIGVLAAIVVSAVASSSIWLPTIGRWLSMPAQPDLHPADVIIVHGGNQLRTQYGLELYHRGLAPELWHTGYAKGEAPLTKILERSGVADQSFRYLVTTSTWSDGQQIAAAIRARKLHNVIIVTDWWHSRRALCSTEQQLQGYDVVISFEPSPSPAGPDNWWRNEQIRSDVESELVKLGYYALRYGMSPWGC